jgi:hypothetical protein
MNNSKKVYKIEDLLYLSKLTETVSGLDVILGDLLVDFRDFRRSVSELDFNHLDVLSEAFMRAVGQGIDFFKRLSSRQLRDIVLSEEMQEKLSSRLSVAYIKSFREVQLREGSLADSSRGMFSTAALNSQFIDDLQASLKDLRDELETEKFEHEIGGDLGSKKLFADLTGADFTAAEQYLESISAYLKPISTDLHILQERKERSGMSDMRAYEEILMRLGVLSPFDSAEVREKTLNTSYTELTGTIDELEMRLKTMFTRGDIVDAANFDDYIWKLRRGRTSELAADTSLSEVLPLAEDLRKLKLQRSLLGSILGIDGSNYGEQKAIENAGKMLTSYKMRKKAEYAEYLDYLREYGSFQQKKLAIAKETAQKIAEVDASEVSDSTKKWKKAQLRKEQQQRESSMKFEEISRGIDWSALFSGVGNLTKEMMEPMMEQLRAYVETEEYRNADAETQQKVTDLIQEMRKYVGTDRSATWQKLDEAIRQFTTSVATYDRAVKAEEAAVKTRDEGKKKLASGEITEEQYRELETKAQELGDATAKAHESMEGFGAALNRTSDEVANFTSGLTTALSNAKAWQGVEGFGGIQQSVGQIDQLKGTLDSILPQMGEGMAKTIGTTLSGTMGSALGSIGGSLEGALSSGLGSVIGIVAQIPKLILDLVDSIKSFVTGILNAITELISLRWIDDLVVSILDAVGNLIDAIFDLPENLFKVLEGIVVKGVGGLLDTVLGRIGNILSFGVLSSKGPSDWFTNSNEEEVAEAIDRLTKRNEQLEQAIEDLTDEMKTARGAIAIRISDDAEKLQRETIDNYKGIAQAQAGYHSAHHSFNYYWRGYSQEQIDRLSAQMGRKWNGDIWNLSPEEMKMLRSNVDMWKLLQDTGKGGYGGRVAEKLDKYIEQAGKLKEITDALYENLTTTTKDNVFDDFLNSLYSLADGSENVFEEIAENWQEMVNKMAVNNLVGAKFQKNLETWYENLAKLNKARTSGEITDAEYRKRLDALKQEYEDYMKSARNDIEQLRNEGIIKETDKTGGTTQSGRSGAFMTMSQDQGTKLEGLFVSGQMHWASIDDRVEDIAVRMSDAQGHLKKIEDNTGSSAQSLKDIKEEMKKITRDGVKVK